MSNSIDAEWFKEMAALMKAREKCLNAISRWEQSLAVTEEEIAALRSGGSAQPVAAVPASYDLPISAVAEFSAATPEPPQQVTNQNQ